MGAMYILKNVNFLIREKAIANGRIIYKITEEMVKMGLV